MCLICVVFLIINVTLKGEKKNVVIFYSFLFLLLTCVLREVKYMYECVCKCVLKKKSFYLSLSFFRFSLLASFFSFPFFSFLFLIIFYGGCVFFPFSSLLFFLFLFLFFSFLFL